MDINVTNRDIQKAIETKAKLATLISRHNKLVRLQYRRGNSQ